MPVRIAIIMTGHPRMVSYSHKLFQMTQEQFPNVELTIFSNVWDPESDIKPEFNQLSVLDAKILDGLRYHRVQNQRAFIDKLYTDYAMTADKPDFSNKAAQFLGMIDAMSCWENELSTFDYIIKSRWDQVVDAESIRFLLKEKTIGFFNKSVYLNNGKIEISGNTIYGDRNSWFTNFMPMSKTMDLIKQFLNENQHLNWSAHELLGYLFRQTKSSVASVGEEWNLRPHLFKIPLEEISIRQVMGVL